MNLRLFSKQTSTPVFKYYTMWTCLDFCKSQSFFLDNIYVHFGDAVYRQVIGIPMGTNCAPLVADLFLYCYERDFMFTTDRAKSVPLSSPLFYVCLTRIFDDLMYKWRYMCVCMGMSVLCLIYGCIFVLRFLHKFFHTYLDSVFLHSQL